MSPIFTFCAMAMTGWASPDFTAPISPAPDKPLVQRSQLQPARSYAARPTNEQAMRPSRMPIAPTDPRAFSRADLPQPPTVNDSGMQSAAAMGGAGPRVNPALFAENSSHRPANQKAFEGYRSTPAISPYTLLNANTDNGTINPYVAYVRPAQERQQGDHDMERGGTDGAADQPAPLYPPAFQNYGSYFPTAH